jgi:hypothetical protein
VTNYGGSFVAFGAKGHGVHGWASNAGVGTNYGGYFEAEGSTGRGAYGKASGTSGVGVFGVAENAGDVTNYGGYFKAEGTTGRGVFGIATGAKGQAVYGYATNSGDEVHYGGYFISAGTHGTGLLAKGGTSGYAADFRGNVIIRNRLGDVTLLELGEGLDVAEGFNVSEVERLEPGTVLIIDPDNPGKLTRSRQSYDKRVAGIVAGANGLGSGVKLGDGQFDYPVALAGRVYCNVDATSGEIIPGDMLTTSDTPGFAMKSTDQARAHGTILGKAMEGLNAGQKGQILVLVTLQ